MAPRPRPIDWLRSRPWWRWQTAAAVAGLMLATTSLIDEIGDRAAADEARRRDDRAQYEAECRFELASKVTTIEGKQIDGFTDLLAALAVEDQPAARAVVDQLKQLKVDKAAADLARQGAVETCNRKATALGFTDG